MAKYDFKPQIKSSFLYNSTLMYILIAAAFAGGWYAMIEYKTSTLVFIPAFILILIYIYFYKPALKFLDMGGYQKLTIDQGQFSVILDDKVKIPFRRITKAKLILDERPTLFWLLTCGHQYICLINGELKLYMDNKSNTSIYVQNRFQAKKILKFLNQAGIKTQIEREKYLQENIPTYIWYLIIILLIIWQIFLMAYSFLQKFLGL